MDRSSKERSRLRASERGAWERGSVERGRSDASRSTLRRSDALRLMVAFPAKEQRPGLRLRGERPGRAVPAAVPAL